MDAGTLTLDLDKPIAVRDTDESRLALRFADPQAAQSAMLWYNAAKGEHIRTDQNLQPGAWQMPADSMSFQVRHDHRIGSETGRLILSPKEVIYESVTDVNSSRR